MDKMNKLLFDAICEAYMPYVEFYAFLESLKRNDNSPLIETIQAGVMAVVEDTGSAFSSGYDPQDTYALLNKELGIQPGELFDRKKGEGTAVVNKTKLGQYIVPPADLHKLMIDAQDKADAYNKANTDKEPIDMWKANKDLKLMALAWVYKIAAEAAVKVASHNVSGQQIHLDKRSEFVDAFDMIRSYLLEKAKVMSTFKVDKTEPGKLAQFVTYATSALTPGVLQGIRLKFIGQERLNKWTPAEVGAIMAPKDTSKMGEWRRAKVYHVPGSYVAVSPGSDEYAPAPKEKYGNRSAKMYIRKFPNTNEERRFNEIKSRLINKADQLKGTDSIKNAANDIMDQMIKAGKIEERLAFTIPADERGIPPDESPYWMDFEQTEGRYANRSLDVIEGDEANEDSKGVSKAAKSGAYTNPEPIKVGQKLPEMIADVAHAILDPYVDGNLTDFGKTVRNNTKLIPGKSFDELQILYDIVMSPEFYEKVPLQGAVNEEHFGNVFITALINSNSELKNDPEVVEKKLGDLSTPRKDKEHFINSKGLPSDKAQKVTNLQLAKSRVKNGILNVLFPEIKKRLTEAAKRGKGGITLDDIGLNEAVRIINEAIERIDSLIIAINS